MSHLPLPYEKVLPCLEDFKIEYSPEEHSSPAPLTSTWTAHIYILRQKRGGQWTDVVKINASSGGTWGSQSKLILDQILSFLNDKTDYKWNEVKKPIVEFWRRKQEVDKQQDIAAGGAGQWNIMSDFTLNQLMKFIAAVFGMKWEILQTPPVGLDEILKLKDAFEQQIAWQAFDEIIVKSKVEGITKSSEADTDKAKQVVDFIIQHSRHLVYSDRSDLLDPPYHDDAPMLSEDESRELSGLFKLQEKYEKETDGDKLLSVEEKKLKKIDFWQTETGKRLNFLNNHRVYGATLSFADKEARKKQTTSRISDILGYILTSWSLPASDGQQYYFDLYAKAFWGREQQQLKMEEMIREGKSQTDSMRNLLKGNWDSNTLTFFGVVVGILLAVFFGFFSILTPLCGWLSGLLASISFTSLTFIALIKLIRKFRRQIIKWTKSVLEVK